MRILLADDHAMFRESLASALAEQAVVHAVSQAKDATEANRLCASERYDLIIMDLALAGPDLPQALHRLQAQQARMRILLLADRITDVDIEKVKGAKAAGLVLKRDGLRTLLGAMQTIRQGGTFFSESVRSRLSTRSGRPEAARSASSAVSRLTERERELLVHLGRGASLKEAAAAMAISYKTADNQKTSLMRKLDIHDRVRLARFAIREGLVSPYDGHSAKHKGYPAKATDAAENGKPGSSGAMRYGKATRIAEKRN